MKIKISKDTYLFGSIATILIAIIAAIVMMFTIASDNIIILFLLFLLLIYYFWLFFYAIKAKEVYLDFDNNCFLIENLDGKSLKKDFNDFVSFKFVCRGFIKLTFKNRTHFFFLYRKDSKSVIKSLNKIAEDNYPILAQE